jgi:hypothetical protein
MLRTAARLLPAIALTALTLAAPGCASFSKYRARAAQVRVEMEAYRYPQPIELVWPQVQRLLADKGLDLAGADAAAVGQKPGRLAQLASAAKATRTTMAGGRVLETDWNQNGLRWRAEANPDAGGLRVVLTQIQRKSDEVGFDGVELPDYELELDLLYRIDPEAGEKIEERASKPAAAR